MAQRRSALNSGGGAVVFDSPAWTRCGGASPGQRVGPEPAQGRREIVADCRGTNRMKQIGIARSTRLTAAMTGPGMNGLFSLILYFTTHMSDQRIAMPF